MFLKGMSTFQDTVTNQDPLQFFEILGKLGEGFDSQIFFETIFVIVLF